MSTHTQEPITSGRWQRVKEIVADALERDAHERAGFVAGACAGEPTILREVESLLQHAGAKRNLEAFADDLAQVRGEQKDPRVGQVVGDYRILRMIRRGGMGAVYLGERADQQFEKQVAIKILKRGTDTDEMLHRFGQERQILAQLAHPNIAHLLDAGATDDGLPYFAMEFIEGAHITDYCFAQNLALPERLRLFLKVCAAVQFAHQNLIVHRDLTPPNILVTAEGEPKLLDFGIAKLLAPGPDAWRMTAAGQERFTPGYASPEQVRAEPVTTVSDVYSLGAVLYELLTGSAPHRFLTASPTEMALVICETEPVRASAAAVDPERRRQLRGDLDVILQRALAKIPARRYRSAGHLADDLRRYLENRPVRARADTLSYRSGKFFRRNKLAAAAAALVFLSLLAGAFATARQARIARREHARAESRFNDVRKIANSFLLEFHKLIADLPGTLAARQLLTQRGQEYLDSLASEAGNDLSLRRELAAAYRQVALITFDIEQSIATHRKAVRLNELLVEARPAERAYQRQLSESYDDLGDMLKIAGHSREATACARRSLAIMQGLASAPGASSEAQAKLADRYGSVAIMLSDAGDFRGALEHALQGSAILEKMLTENPSYSEAERERVNIYARLSDFYMDAGDLEHAMTYASRQFESAQQFFAADPSNSRARRDMWAGHFRVGRQLAANGSFEGALANYDRATEFLEALSAADTADKGHRRWLAVTYSGTADVLAALGRRDEARAKYERAIAISEGLARDDAARVESRRDLVKMHNALGELHLRSGEHERALESFRRAEPLANKLSETDPENGRVRSSLAETLAGMAACHYSLASRPESLTADRELALRSAQQLYDRCLQHWQIVKDAGMLRSADATKPRVAKRGRDECSAALARSSVPC